MWCVWTGRLPTVLPIAFRSVRPSMMFDPFVPILLIVSYHTYSLIILSPWQEIISFIHFYSISFYFFLFRNHSFSFFIIFIFSNSWLLTHIFISSFSHVIRFIFLLILFKLVFRALQFPTNTVLTTPHTICILRFHFLSIFVNWPCDFFLGHGLFNIYIFSSFSISRREHDIHSFKLSRIFLWPMASRPVHLDCSLKTVQCSSEKKTHSSVVLGHVL